MPKLSMETISGYCPCASPGKTLLSLWLIRKGMQTLVCLKTLNFEVGHYKKTAELEDTVMAAKPACVPRNLAT